MAKIALLIGVSEYEPGLERLPSAVNDVAAMQQVLTHPDMGGFAADAVTVLRNPDRQTMENAIYTLFANRAKEDLVLLYFSGHGVLDESAEFYFATRLTRKEQGRVIPPTAVAARSVRDWMEQSRSQHKVIILDSCFSGAFAKGVKAKDSGSVNPEQFLGGKGIAILTASTSTQYALAQEGFELSVYTHYLVEGIRTGGADQDDDGLIAMDELHAYASSKVKEAAPAMTPEFYPVKDGYRILLAKSPKDDPSLKYRKQVERYAQQGKFTIPARRLLNSQRLQLKLTPDVAEAIETEVLQPYREYQRKLQEYEDTLVEALKIENPLSQRTLNDLK
ncbi:MAG: caspase family protein, partial [Kovacikia sp.]